MTTMKWRDAESVHKISRRALLVGVSSSLLALGACADQSSDRQFAGDRRTAETGNAESTQTTIGEIASPQAVATSLPVSKLLEARGSHPNVLVHNAKTLVAIDTENRTNRELWTDDDRSIWMARLDPAGIRAALLTSRAGTATDFRIEFVDLIGGEHETIQLDDGTGDGSVLPDAVAGGRGGLDWLPDSSGVAVSLPTGGLVQLSPDGTRTKLVKAAVAKRPAAVAISPDGGTLAFVEQSSLGEGSGILAGSMKATPVDPIVILPADRSGNRYAREIGWLGTTNRVVTIIDRKEVGTTQGDLFYLDTTSRSLELAWTSSGGRDIASVVAFEVAPGGAVIAFLTNPVHTNREKPSSVWFKQTDGPAIERFDLPVQLSGVRLWFTSNGLAVTGVANEQAEEHMFGFLISPSGEITDLYEEKPPGTPIASPVASPVASPIASPVGSPLASPIPVESSSSV